MAELTVSLTDERMEFDADQAAKAGRGTPEDYVVALIRDQRKRLARERVEALLKESLESGPATPMTAEEWDDIRRGVRERLANRGSAQ